MRYRKLIGKCLNHNSNKNAQTALALVAGLAVGAIVSVLFAPDSGEGTRGKLADGAKKLRYGFQDKYNLLKEKVFGVDAIEGDILAQEIPHIKHKVERKNNPEMDSYL